MIIAESEGLCREALIRLLLHSYCRAGKQAVINIGKVINKLSGLGKSYIEIQICLTLAIKLFTLEGFRDLKC